MANPPLTITHTAEVTEDQIDELGHMNVRWYAHKAFAATSAMTERLDLGDVPVVSAYTRHHHEQLLGNRLEVRTGVLAGDPLRLYHELRNSADDDLAATFVHELDHSPIEASAVELPDHGRPRSIAIDADALGSAPTLDAVRSDGLAMRHAREVDADEDARGASRVPAWNAPSLFWNGEALEGDGEWIRTTPDGVRFASATMESRLWIGQLPEVGTRIQSFGAPIAIADKVSQHIHWVFALDTGELLGVMETVNLAFDMDARRAISIPDDNRAWMTERLRPDLAPDR